MQSWVGKIVDSCISMAISDFYSLNSHYKTKLALHTRNSEGDPFLALSHALVLLGKFKLHAIIVAEHSAGAKILAELGSKAKIPIISLFAPGPSLSFSEYPYLIQIGEDNSSQARAIVTIAEEHWWKKIILIYEDNDSAREILPQLIMSLEGSDVLLAKHITVLPSNSDEEIIEQMKMVMSLQTTIYVVHMSPSIASRVFLIAKQLGMVNQGSAWITTDMIMNFLHSMDPLVIQSMQGVLGLKPYFPASKELHKFTLRWRMKNHVETQSLEEMELNVYGIWTYDMIWALATAGERVKTGHPDITDQEAGLNINFTTIFSTQSGMVFMNEILKIRFKGISGDFQLINGRLIPKEFEIVNVFKGERTVGYWTQKDGITPMMKQDDHYEMNSKSYSSKLEAVTWPGGTLKIPKGWSLHGKKLRIGVPVSDGFRELINVTVDPQTNKTTITGFCADVFKAAIKTLDYEVNYDFIPFINAKGQMAGTYNDLLYQVYVKNYDAVVGDTTIISSRFSYVDFTLPYTDVGIGIIVPKTTSKNSIWIFLKPLAGDLWITTAAFFIFIGFVVWLIEHPINDEFQGSPLKQIGMIFWYSFSTLVFAHKEKLLSNLSKFVVIIWVFVVLILTSSYTATLASMLTIQRIQLNSRDDYVGYHSFAFLPSATSNLNYGNPRLKPYQSAEEYATALTKGSKNGGVSAIIDEIPYVKVFLSNYPAGYTMIRYRSGSETSGFGFAFPKGSPLVQDISSAISKLREEGKLQMMENVWFSSRSSFTTTEDSTTSNPSSLNLHSFGGLFLVTGVSSISALLIFLFQNRQSMTINFKFYLKTKLDSIKGSSRSLLKIGS
ncbi:Ionotropic glutamate receptor [Corchorus olitorius]|uniref:Glutamate receptor n=1 Tax=Corchorus olitorius TaxID=93759 RepID=A0A1R3KLM2_9ROSI|nr:Ionotropic glutamate receptor [Corchorus olitorius]